LQAGFRPLRTEKRRDEALVDIGSVFRTGSAAVIV
jgi:hypothetical protein